MAYAESIRSFLTRPYPILTGSWTGDQAQGVSLSSFDPLKVYMNIPRIYGKLQGFDYLRAGLRFEIRMNGTRFHYGQAVAGFHPLTHLRSYVAADASATQLTMYPGVTLDPGPSQVGVFQVPYVYPQHFISLHNTSAERSLGTFHLKVLVPLRVVSQTTVPSVQYTVYVSLVDPIVNAFTSEALPAVLRVQEQSGDSAIRVVPENMNFLATDINNVAVRAGMQGDNRVDKSEDTIGTERSDMLLSTIYTKPNFVLLSTWSSASVAGTILDSMTVTPNYPGTYLSMLYLLSGFWRGSIRFHTRIVASGFHSGRMTISWDPTAIGNTTVMDVTNRMHMVVDLQQTTDVYYTIPYMSLLPWLPTTNTATNGRVFYNVLNPLSTPSGEPTTVNILTWMYGSDDLEFACPKTNTSAVPTPTDLVEEQCCDQPLNDNKFGNLDGSFSVPGQMVMGEKLTTVVDWMSKMAYGASATGFTTATYFTFYASNVPGDRSPVVTSHMYQLSRIYVVSRGSVRYAPRLYSAVTRLAPIDQYHVGFSTTAQSDERFGVFVVRPATPNSIIQIPFYSVYTFVPTRQIIATQATYIPTATVTGATGIAVTWNYGAGEDFMFSYLVPPLAS